MSAPTPTMPMGHGVQAKVVLVGTTGVGKTSLLAAKVSGSGASDDRDSVTTVSQQHSYTYTKEGKSLVVQVWDTAGMEKYRSLNNLYYRNADGILIVFDVTSSSSFDCVPGFYDQAKSVSPNLSTMFLVGNKSDMGWAREVDEERAREYARSNNMEYIEVSAKCFTNVAELFEGLAECLLTAKIAGPRQQPADDILMNPDTNKKCC